MLDRDPWTSLSDNVCSAESTPRATCDQGTGGGDGQQGPAGGETGSAGGQADGGAKPPGQSPAPAAGDTKKPDSPATTAQAAAGDDLMKQLLAETSALRAQIAEMEKRELAAREELAKRERQAREDYVVAQGLAKGADGKPNAIYLKAAMETLGDFDHRSEDGKKKVAEFVKSHAGLFGTAPNPAAASPAGGGGTKEEAGWAPASGAGPIRTGMGAHIDRDLNRPLKLAASVH